LHDEEVWIVDVQLDGLEEVLHSMLLSAMPVYQVLARASQYNLSSYGNLIAFFETDWTLLLVSVVEDDGNARLCDASLTALVD